MTTENRLDDLVASARAELHGHLDPTPAPFVAVARRRRARRGVVAVAVAALVTLIAVPLIARDDDPGPNIVAGPGANGNADLLPAGQARPLAPSPLVGRSTLAAVWTGSEMILWGGDTPNGPVADGAAYDPRRDTWERLPDSPLSARNAPAAVWTGTEMLLWGGHARGADHVDGAAYNPATGRWRSLPDAPFASAGRPVGVWTGTEMIVLAGFNSDRAGAYDPATDRWRELPSLPGNLQAPNPVAVWASERVYAVVQGHRTGLDTGPRVVSLRPGDDEWAGTSPLERGSVVLTWTGDAVLAAAGSHALQLATDDERWHKIATAPAGAAVGDTPAVWTGSQLLLWEGDRASVIDPDDRTWRPIASGDTTRRTQPAVVWADGVLLAWGGFPDQSTGVMLRPPSSGTAAPPAPPIDDAAMYSPVTDVDGTPTVLAIYRSPRPEGGVTGRIDVLEWTTAWRTVASLPLGAEAPLEREEPERPLVVVDITGDGTPDFLVPLDAASTTAYQVISSASGTWRQVPFGSPERITVTEPDLPTAGRFVTSSNLCEPTCSDGHYRRELWRYSTTEEWFVLVDTAACDAVSPGRWRCDPADSPLASGQPINAAASPATGPCVSDGPASVDVPNVVELRLADAIERAEAAGLRVLGTGVPDGDPTGGDADVRAQEPAAGTRVPSGACIGFRTET